MSDRHIHEPTAASLFFTNPDFYVVVCRKCSHAVHRGHISRHLTSTHHPLPLSVARYVQSTVKQWDSIEAIMQMKSPRNCSKSIHFQYQSKAVLFRILEYIL